MSISFFRGLEPVVGALLLVVVVVVGIFLVWLGFLGFLGKAASSAELAPDVLKIEGDYVTDLGGGVRVCCGFVIWVGAVLSRMAYVYKSGDAGRFADGLPWVVGPGRMEYLDV